MEPISFFQRGVRRIAKEGKSASRVFKYPYWWIVNLGYKLKLLQVSGIPIVINNFNRLTIPLQLIVFLEACGFTRIIILDNHSTYPPLLKFYERCQHKVIKLSGNYGHLAFWKSGLYHSYKWNYFVYTDSDVVPIEDCPRNFMHHFKSVLDNHGQLDKTGFGIKIDDLPDSFALKDKVVAYEKRYWEKESEPNIYDAPIDTTFALYRPLSNLKEGEIYTLPACRLGFPFLVRHLPWYMDSGNLSEEENYYLQTCNDSSSIGQHQKGNENVY